MKMLRKMETSVGVACQKRWGLTGVTFWNFSLQEKVGKLRGRKRWEEEAEFIFFPVERKGEKEGSERKRNNKCRKGLFGWTNLNFKFLNQDGGKKGVGGGRFFGE